MEILFIIFLVILNGLFAMSEIAIISSRKAKLQQWADDGIASAKIALELANNPSHFLSAIQVGITLIGVMSGAFGEALIADDLEKKIALIPLFAPYSKAIALTIVVVCLTYLSLIIGELVPKRLALHNAEKTAAIVARPMTFFTTLSYPLVKFLSFSTDSILKLLGSKPSQEPPVTGDEINVLMEQGTEAGVFEKSEQQIVSNVFQLTEKSIESIMVPRTSIFYLDVEDSFETNRKKMMESHYSRVPVCRGGVDNVLGVLSAKDLLAQSLSQKTIDLLAIIKKPVYMPESISAMQLLQAFKESITHIAFVVDEYGSLKGLVTLNDVMEAIVGSFASNDVANELEAMQRDDGSWLLGGMLSLDQFKEIFNIEELPEEDLQNYHTISGFVITQLSRIPNVGDHFEWHDLHFEIVDMDKNRIDKVLVKKLDH